MEEEMHELIKLKLRIESVLKEKTKADIKAQALTAQVSALSTSAEALRNEIEDVNDEHVLVELARIEARSELKAVLTQKREQHEDFKSRLDQTKAKVNDVTQEIHSSRELEIKLAHTLRDIDVLRSELKQDREVDQKRKAEISQLKSVTRELEMAKEELAFIKKEGFGLMSSMDVVRNELTQAVVRTSRLHIAEHKAGLYIQSLNSKLLRFKSTLQSSSVSSGAAQEIVSNLRATIKRTQAESDAANKGIEFMNQQIKFIKSQITLTESETDANEERLEAAMQELETVTSSEAAALEKLKTATQQTMSARSASASHRTITVSEFEYAYLTGRATEAGETADKKIEAAEAWIEALKSSEKEILIRYGLAQRQLLLLGDVNIDNSPSPKREVEDEEEGGDGEGDVVIELRRPTRDNWTPARRARYRKSAASPSFRMYTPASTSITLRKRKKALLSLSKLFRGKTDEESY